MSLGLPSPVDELLAADELDAIALGYGGVIDQGVISNSMRSSIDVSSTGCMIVAGGSGNWHTGLGGVHAAVFSNAIIASTNLGERFIVNPSGGFLLVFTLPKQKGFLFFEEVVASCFPDQAVDEPSGGKGCEGGRKQNEEAGATDHLCQPAPAPFYRWRHEATSFRAS